MMQCAAFVMARTWRQEARRWRWARLLSPSQAPSERIICTTEVTTMQRIDALPASSAGVSVLCPVVGATHLSPLMRARHAFAARQRRDQAPRLMHASAER